MPSTPPEQPELSLNEKYKHHQLVEVAYKWVLKSTSCGVAFKELRTLSNGEFPDVLGFGSDGHSVLVEVKVSRSDFLADKKKIVRVNPQLGMGRQRFYCCPAGLIKKEELPEGWGLVYVNNEMKARCVHFPYKGNIGERHDGFPHNLKAEHGFMYSVLRRLEIRGLIDEIYIPREEGVARREQFKLHEKKMDEIKAENIARNKEWMAKILIERPELFEVDFAVIKQYVESGVGENAAMVAFEKAISNGNLTWHSVTDAESTTLEEINQYCASEEGKKVAKDAFEKVFKKEDSKLFK